LRESGVRKVILLREGETARLGYGLVNNKRMRGINEFISWTVVAFVRSMAGRVTELGLKLYVSLYVFLIYKKILLLCNLSIFLTILVLNDINGDSNHRLVSLDPY
jgi:hypothetical protein